MFKAFRILILLFILAMVASTTVLTKWRSTSWKRPLQVAIYPLNGDGRTSTQHYIASLNDESLAPLATFFEREAKHYQLALTEPLRFKLGPQVQALPPERPAGSVVGSMLWSLYLRWWAWRNDGISGTKPDIRLFVLFHDPAGKYQLPHSLGLEKGMLGVVHAFAERSMAGSNQMVMAHELLHTVGATDKYAPGGIPLYPEGFAEPQRTPRYPQRHAEVMAGRIPLTPEVAEIPESLQRVLIGEQTAREIGWLR